MFLISFWYWYSICSFSISFSFRSSFNCLFSSIKDFSLMRRFLIAPLYFFSILSFLLLSLKRLWLRELYLSVMKSLSSFIFWLACDKLSLSSALYSSKSFFSFITCAIWSLYSLFSFVFACSSSSSSLSLAAISFCNSSAWFLSWSITVFLLSKASLLCFASFIAASKFWWRLSTWASKSYIFSFFLLISIVSASISSLNFSISVPTTVSFSFNVFSSSECFFAYSSSWSFNFFISLSFLLRIALVSYSSSSCFELMVSILIFKLDISNFNFSFSTLRSSSCFVSFDISLRYSVFNVVSFSWYFFANFVSFSVYSFCNSLICSWYNAIFFEFDSIDSFFSFSAFNWFSYSSIWDTKFALTFFKLSTFSCINFNFSVDFAVRLWNSARIVSFALSFSFIFNSSVSNRLILFSYSIIALFLNSLSFRMNFILSSKFLDITSGLIGLVWDLFISLFCEV